MKNVDIAIEDIARNLEVKVNLKGLKVWIVRLWISKMLIWLAVKIAGANLEFEEGE